MSEVLKKGVKAQEAVVGTFVQKISMNEASIAMKRDTEKDAVSHVLHFASSIFKKECKDNLIDVSESIKNIRLEHAAHKKDDGVVFIAWKLDHKTNSVEAVGIATLSTLRVTPSFSTDKMGYRDEKALSKYMGYTYLDCLCSKQRGVGKLLTLHAFVHSLRQHKKGLVALSYTRHADREPQSFQMFKRLGFKTIVKNASFDGVENMHGTWMVRNETDLRPLGISDTVLSTCTRKKRSGSFTWRC